MTSAGGSRQAITVAPRHPLSLFGAKLFRMSLQFGKVLEGVHVICYASGQADGSSTMSDGVRPVDSSPTAESVPQRSGTRLLLIKRELEKELEHYGRQVRSYLLSIEHVIGQYRIAWTRT